MFDEQPLSSYHEKIKHAPFGFISIGFQEITSFYLSLFRYRFFLQYSLGGKLIAT
jgi:hypothetical protein